MDDRETCWADTNLRHRCDWLLMLVDEAGTIYLIMGMNELQQHMHRCCLW
jgi:hypothetical protein